MNAIPPALHPAAAALAGGRFGPAGVLTSGGRLTLLTLLTGLVLLGQAWQAAHRLGQHTAAQPGAPLPAVVRRLPDDASAAPLSVPPNPFLSHEPTPAHAR